MHWWQRSLRHVEWTVASVGNEWSDFCKKIPVKGIDNDQDVNYYRRGSARTYYCWAAPTMVTRRRTLMLIVVREVPSLADDQRLTAP